MTWKRLYVTPISCTRVRFGVSIEPPNVSGPPKPASSIRQISTFGAPSGGFGSGIIAQSATDSSNVRRRAAERPVGNRQLRSVGLELVHRLSQRLLQRSTYPPLVPLHERAEHRAAERLLDPQPLILTEHRDDPGRAWGQIVSDLLVDLTLEPMIDEPTNGTPPPRCACSTETLPSSACVTRSTPSTAIILSLTCATSDSKSSVAVSMS